MTERRLGLLAMVPYGGAVVELGVAKGEFSEAMLLQRPDLTVYSVDRWTDHHDEKEYRGACERLAPFGKASVIWRMTFADAAKEVEDGVVDMVYVDGYAHTGQDNGQTLRDWFPKVTPGGVFAGHDYCAEFQPTIDAVDRFAREIGATVNVIEGGPGGVGIASGNPSWWIRKPKV